MGTRSQAKKHSGLKWGSLEVGINEKVENIQKKQCVDDLDMSPIACAPLPKPSNTRELRRTTVQRSKVKSPTNQLKMTRRREKGTSTNASGKEDNPGGSEILDEEVSVKKKSRTPRTRMEELVQQV